MNLEITARLQYGAFTLDVNNTFPLQGVTALFGRSGCGKTTLLRVIAGLERPRGARVRYGDQTWQGDASFVPLAKRRIGLVFQEHSLLPHRDVRGNLEYGYRRTAPDVRRLHLPEVAELLGIEDLLDRRIDQLSGGQRQRVALGRALLCSPQLLLLDEPLAALDTQTKREIMPFLNRLSREAGVPIVLVTHVPDEVERLADRVAFMHDGRVERVEDLHAALTRPNSPLFDEEGPVSVLAGALSAPDDEGLCQFECDGVSLRVPDPGGPPDRGPQRLRIRARDVILAVNDPKGISVVNHLPVTIEAVHPGPRGESLVVTRLSNGQALLAHITTASLRRLGLAAGGRCIALIKSLALHQPAVPASR
jgi:molybdate transport system ATP-binding protein